MTEFIYNWEYTISGSGSVLSHPGEQPDAIRHRVNYAVRKHISLPDDVGLSVDLCQRGQVDMEIDASLPMIFATPVERVA